MITQVEKEFVHTRHLEHHKHSNINLVELDSKHPKIALVGNPNVGKSVIFNFLSGLYVDVSNYPGTTVELSTGQYRDYTIYDTPGVYGISAFSAEEIVTRDIVLEADVILNVVDSVHLERDLFLTQHLIDLGKKVSLILNFQDELKRQGIRINTTKLSELLGIPVFQTSAIHKAGLDGLEKAIIEAQTGIIDHKLHTRLHSMLAEIGSQAEALLVLEGDEDLANKHGIQVGIERENVYIERRNRVNSVVNTVLSETKPQAIISSILGRWAVNFWTGIPMLFGVLYLIYLFVGRWVAGDLVNITEKYLGHKMWEPWIRGVISSFIRLDFWLGILFVGEFGILSMTVTYLLFLLLPLVMAFYLVLSLMEDSGYLPRLATLVDRSLNAIGLNGSAVIPLILGFGCVTMATITTRLLGSEREKTIATTILQLAIPCSAQIAVIAALLAGAGFLAMITYSITIFIVLVAVGTILHRLLPGESSPLLIDLPPLRLPRLDNIARKTIFRSFAFMKEATPWFFAGALAVGIMQLTGLLEIWQDILAPFVTGWLQLPREASTTFVMGLVRRDFGAAGLYNLVLTPDQIVVSLVTITLFVPCIASLIVMMKERGTKQALLIWIVTWIGAFMVGGIVSQILI